jgi:hypothetical protein
VSVVLVCNASSTTQIEKRAVSANPARKFPAQRIRVEKFNGISALYVDVNVEEVIHLASLARQCYL